MATAEQKADGLYGKLKKLSSQLAGMPSWRMNTPEYQKLAEKVRTTELAFEQASNKVKDYKDKISQIEAGSLKEVKGSIDGISNSIGKTIKKVGKWTLAIFGLRSAYLAVRTAIGIISQYDEQLTANINYIKYALANSIRPVIDWIVNQVYNLLQLLRSVVLAMFNFDMFANSSVESFNKVNGTANKIKKTLLGFDELNILGEDSSDSSGVGGGTPSFDFGEPNTEQTNKWKNAILDISDFWEKESWEMMENAEGNWALCVTGLLLMGTGFYDIFKGIIDTAIGLIQMFVGVFTGNVDLMEKGWKKFTSGIVNILKGAIEIVIGVFFSVIGLITGLLSDLVSIIYKNIIVPIGNFFVGLWNGIVKGVTVAVDAIKNVFNSVVNFFKNIISTIVGFFKNMGVKAGEAIGSAFKTVINGVLFVIEKILNTPIKAINKLIEVINNIPGIKLGYISTFSLPRLATGGIVDVPKRGVNIGGAIAGEAGAEGVLPLTNADTMSKLGKEIGKWITINANITNEIDGRVLNKRLQQLNNQNAFSRNGG